MLLISAAFKSRLLFWLGLFFIPTAQCKWLQLRSKMGRSLSVLNVYPTPRLSATPHSRLRSPFLWNRCSWCSRSGPSAVTTENLTVHLTWAPAVLLGRTPFLLSSGGATPASGRESSGGHTELRFPQHHWAHWHPSTLLPTTASRAQQLNQILPPNPWHRIHFRENLRLCVYECVYKF